MKKIDIGQAITILANLSVLGGLIFVGLQMQQDREIAQIQRRQTGTELRNQWADLIAANADVWSKGLSGETLTNAEAATFDALANAWQFNVFQEWSNSRSSAMYVDQEVAPEITESFIRLAAREILANPGLRQWVFDFHDTLRQIGRYGIFNELIEAEMLRLDEIQTSSSNE